MFYSIFELTMNSQPHRPGISGDGQVFSRTLISALVQFGSGTNDQIPTIVNVDPKTDRCMHFQISKVSTVTHFVRLLVFPLVNRDELIRFCNENRTKFGHNRSAARALA